jgi:hypothetical protein
LDQTGARNLLRAGSNSVIATADGRRCELQKAADKPQNAFVGYLRPSAAVACGHQRLKTRSLTRHINRKSAQSIIVST